MWGCFNACMNGFRDERRVDTSRPCRLAWFAALFDFFLWRPCRTAADAFGSAARAAAAALFG